MLYSPGGVKPFRIQGAFVSDAEVERLADYIREQEKARYVKEDFELKPTPAERAKAHRGLDGEELEDDDYDGGDDGPGRLSIEGRAGMAPLKPGDVDALSDEELFDMALRLLMESRKGSVSYIQRRMKIGYARAGRLMDMMEERGIVGPYQGSKPRDIAVDPARVLRNLDRGLPFDAEDDE
jgi:S-DNA-T family DNA segregation ATPase FtsK/SpoIIIE